MFNSKKAQISDTLSWGVATIVIVILLAIPIALVETNVSNKGNSIQRIPDGADARDALATKSISGYLLKNRDVIIKDILDKKELSSTTILELENFFGGMSRDKNKETWNVLIELNQEKIYPKITDGTLLTSGHFETYFYFGDNNKISFKFFRRQTLKSLIW